MEKDTSATRKHALREERNLDRPIFSRCPNCGMKFCWEEGPICDCERCEKCEQLFWPSDLVNGLCEECRAEKQANDREEEEENGPIETAI